MGAPSPVHEERVALLRAVAALAGHTVGTDQLVDGCRPDLFALDLSHRSVLLGDAKATESPHGAATAMRLVRYLLWLNAARGAGADGGFLLCCPPVAARAWADQLVVLAGLAGLRRWTVTIDRIDGHALVAAR